MRRDPTIKSSRAREILAPLRRTRKNLDAREILAALYRDPQGYDRGDLLVTLQAESATIFPDTENNRQIEQSDLPQEPVTREAIWELIKDLNFVWARPVREAAKEITERQAATLLEMLLHGEVDIQDPHDAETLSVVVDNLADKNPSDWWAKAQEYWEHLQNFDDLDARLDLESQLDYAKAILACAYLDKSADLSSSMTDLDKWDLGEAAQYAQLPYALRTEDDFNENEWWYFEALSQYAKTSPYQTSISAEANEEAAAATLAEFIEAAGPLRYWLDHQYIDGAGSWLARCVYEDPRKLAAMPPKAIMYYPLADLDARLADYPLLDEEAEGEKRMDAEAQAIQELANEAAWGADVDFDDPEDENWGHILINQLHENEGDWYPEIDDQGYLYNAPDSETILDAMRELGWIK